MTRKLTAKELKDIDEAMENIHAYVQPAQYPTESQADAAAAREAKEKEDIKQLLLKLVPKGCALNHLLRYTKEFSVNNYQDALLNWLTAIDAMVNTISPDTPADHDIVFMRAARFARATTLNQAAVSFNTLAEFKPHIGLHNLKAKLDQCETSFKAQQQKSAADRDYYDGNETYVPQATLRQALLKKDTKLLLGRTRSDSAALKTCAFGASDLSPLRAHQPVNAIGRGPRF